MENLNETKVFEFLKFVNALKLQVRRGWEQHGCDKKESVASHMYSMGMMTFLLGNESKLDRFRCLQLALVHDLAESIVGDITPADGVSAEEKHKREMDAMKKILAPIDGEIGTIISDLYEEYEARATPEAKFVKDLDRFDLMFTAWQFEQDGFAGQFERFYSSSKDEIQHPFVQKLTKALLLDKANTCLTNGKV